MTESIDMIIQFTDDENLTADQVVEMLRGATGESGIEYRRLEPYLAWNDPDPAIRSEARKFEILDLPQGYDADTFVSYLSSAQNQYLVRDIKRI